MLSSHCTWTRPFGRSASTMPRHAQDCATTPPSASPSPATLRRGTKTTISIRFCCTKSLMLLPALVLATDRNGDRSRENWASKARGCTTDPSRTNWLRGSGGARTVTCTIGIVGRRVRCRAGHARSASRRRTSSNGSTARSAWRRAELRPRAHPEEGQRDGTVSAGKRRERAHGVSRRMAAPGDQCRQNSFPSGSAIVYVTGPRSSVIHSCFAPSFSSSATRSSLRSDGTGTSRCTRFFAVLGSGTC